MTVHLPDELAPALRQRAEQLLAECRPAETGELDTRSRQERSGRAPCYVCKGGRPAWCGAWRW